jgi:hypothetical protein
LNQLGKELIEQSEKQTLELELEPNLGLLGEKRPQSGTTTTRTQNKASALYSNNKNHGAPLRAGGDAEP